MTWIAPTTLHANGLRLEPLQPSHEKGLRAIERLGAKKDGVIRGHALRRDGTIRDTVMYSLTQGGWPEARAHLQYLLAQGQR